MKLPRPAIQTILSKLRALREYELKDGKVITTAKCEHSIKNKHDRFEIAAAIVRIETSFVDDRAVHLVEYDIKWDADERDIRMFSEEVHKMVPSAATVFNLRIGKHA